MSGSTILGIVLMAFGVIGLAYEGITYTSREKVVDMGPIQISADRERTIPITPIVAGCRSRPASPSCCCRGRDDRARRGSTPIAHRRIGRCICRFSITEEPCETEFSGGAPACAALSVALLTAGGNPPPAPPGPDSDPPLETAGAEVLMRGPLHEAFAAPVVFDATAGLPAPSSRPSPLRNCPPTSGPTATPSSGSPAIGVGTTTAATSSG